MDNSKIDMDQFMNAKDSLAAKPSNYEMAIQNDLTEEKNPIKQNVIVTKGLYQSTLGGSVQFVDATGGTVILSYDPVTGTITLNGGVIIGQTVSVGTLANALFTGGTITNSILPGTLDNKVLGTPAITGGTIINSKVNNPTIGTPSLSGGTYTSPRIAGIANYPINIGSPALTNSGDFEIQTKGGSVQIAIKSGTDTFFFVPAGTQ